MIAPGGWLGLLGGGQLGRMFCMAAQSMGYRIAVLDPGREGPAATVADHHVCADYADHGGLAALAARVQAATTEFENVPAESLAYLATQVQVAPGAASVAIAQDRILEKSFLHEQGFAVAPFAVLANAVDASSVDDALLPGILKRARFGYDGKGQTRVRSPDEVRAAWTAMGEEACVLERMLELHCEISVIVARNTEGAAVTWPVSENLHRDGILDMSIIPARIAPELADEARAAALSLAAKLDYRGVLCVEFFIVGDGRLLINEIAPRPHNSGHYSIDACVTSQFEQQVRVLAGVPMGDTRQHQSAVMINLLGDLWFGESDVVREPAWPVVLAHPEAKLHLYGKKEPRRGRKMGHVTCIATDLEHALDVARRIRAELGMPE